jgi:drug/metabolite transporter (DMT)-like permease
VPTSVLYLLTIFIWGASWFAITLQLGEVEPQISIVYRFVIAAGVLLIYCLLRKRPLRYGLKDHARFAFIGLFLFNLNYIFIYYASYDLTSGLISVVFSCVQIFNMLIGYLVLKDRVTPGMLVGALIGIAGIALVFWPEIDQLDLNGLVLQSIGLTFAGTLSASIGMITSARFQRQNYPILQTNAWGMTWGCAWMTLYVLVAGVEWSFEYTATYVWALLWLAIPSTVLGFGCFLTLVGRLGAARASYAMIIFPIVSLGISTVYEGYNWTLIASLGVLLAIVGNVIIMLGKQSAAR